MLSSPSIAEKKHWWLTTRKIAEKYVREARDLAARQDQADVAVAMGLVEAALALSPRMEAAVEMKARCLLLMRRYREVADMLQDYIPSFKVDAVSDECDSSGSGGSSCSSMLSDHSGSHRAKLLPGENRSEGEGGFRCFSVADLKKKVLAGICGGGDTEGQWRYLVLGQACCHLGLMEDAMVLLQTGRRLASAAFRRESVCWSDDSFSLSNSTAYSASAIPPPPPPPLTESESASASHLLSHIKLLLRRRTAALAALDAGLPNEAVRHFSKILDSRRGIPHAFATVCLVGRAAAYRAAGRLAEAIADCNRALAIDQTSIPALRARADLLESVRALPDCLRDLDHLKLLYDSILRDRKLPGPAWRPHHGVRYRDIPSNLRTVMNRIQDIRMRLAGGDACGVDYYSLIGVRRGCARSELERAHLVLSLRHKPDKALGFVDRLEFTDHHCDLDAVRDQARMSALILYRMLQKGYSSIMTTVMDEEAAERQRVKQAKEAAAAAAAAATTAALKEKIKLDKKAGAVCSNAYNVGSQALPEKPNVLEKIELDKKAGAVCSNAYNVGSQALPEKPDVLEKIKYNVGSQALPEKPDVLEKIKLDKKAGAVCSNVHNVGSQALPGKPDVLEKIMLDKKAMALPEKPAAAPKVVLEKIKLDKKGMAFLEKPAAAPKAVSEKIKLDKKVVAVCSKKYNAGSVALPEKVAVCSKEYNAGSVALPEKAAAAVFQGVFCRDLAAVGSLIAQAGFNRAIPVKYEALSC